MPITNEVSFFGWLVYGIKPKISKNLTQEKTIQFIYPRKFTFFTFMLPHFSGEGIFWGDGIGTGV